MPGALAAAAVLLGSTGTAVAAPATGTVARVVDGDTVQVRSAGRSRTVELLGVDAPELRGAPARSCHGTAAKRALSRLLPKGASVRLTKDAKGPRAGRYLHRGGRLINLSVLSTGNAPSRPPRGSRPHRPPARRPAATHSGAPTTTWPDASSSA